MNYSDRSNTDTRVPTSSMEPIKYFHRLVHHEDFYQILLLAAKVKAARLTLNQSPSPSLKDVEDSIQNATKSIQSSFKSDAKVLRGNFVTTDSLVDESIQIMERELSRCLDSQKVCKKKENTAEPIAVKYSKCQTDILTQWMIDHREHPFPTSQEMEQLGKLAGLSYSQVVNWTTNVRKRNLKATVQGGKKPHHFLDFLFLAEHRDQHRRDGTIPASFVKLPARTKLKRLPKKSSDKVTFTKPKNHFQKKKSSLQQNMNLATTNTYVPRPMPVIVTPPRPIHGVTTNRFFPTNYPANMMPCHQHQMFYMHSSAAHPNNNACQARNYIFNDRNASTQKVITDSRLPPSKLNLNVATVENEAIEHLLQEEIMSPRESEAKWLADALLDPNVEVQMNAMKDSLLSDNPKRPSLSHESIEKVLALKLMESADFEALLNSPMEDFEDTDMITMCSI